MPISSIPGSFQEKEKDPFIGRVIDGKYRIVSRIGEGGFGIVYRAWADALNHYVVVKIPRREKIVDSPLFLNRFFGEIDAMMVFNHPSIIPTINKGKVDNLPYIVMGYLSGGSLKDRMPNKETGRARLPAVGLHDFVPQIGDALDYIHLKGYVHRDVKPDNILFDGLGRACLGDFGIAKVIQDEETLHNSQDLTKSGIICGTPNYIAPEQIRSTDPLTGLLDQYALAVIVYELLRGVRPFEGTNQHLYISHLTANPPSLQDACPELPNSLCQAVHRGLEKNPLDRFETCRKFSDALLCDVPSSAQSEHFGAVCPKCHYLCAVRRSFAGSRVLCPRCQENLFVSPDQLCLYLINEVPKRIFESHGVVQRSLHHVKNQAAIQIRSQGILRGHRGAVRKVLYSKSCLRFLTVSEDRTLRLWNSETETEVKVLGGFVDPMVTMALSPDGKMFAGGTSDGKWLLGEASDGCEKLKNYGHSDMITDICFSTNGNLVATASADCTARLWAIGSQPISGEKKGESYLLNGHSESIEVVCFSPKGDRVVTGSLDSTARVWDVYRRHQQKQETVLQPNAGAIFCAIFSPDGRRIATGSSEGSISLWDVESGVEIAKLKAHTHALKEVFFLSEGQGFVSVGEDNCVKLWDCQQMPPQLQFSISGVTASVMPNGRYLATGCTDHAVRLWDIKDSKEKAVFVGLNDVITSICFVEETNRLAASSQDRTVLLWDIQIADNEKVSARTPLPAEEQPLDTSASNAAEKALQEIQHMSQPKGPEVIGGYGFNRENENIESKTSKQSLTKRLARGILGSDEE